MRDRTIRPFLKAIAAMAVIAALSGVQSAQAAGDQELRITVDGFTTTFSAANGGSAGGTIANFHGVAISAGISDFLTYPGTAGQAELETQTVTLADVNGATHQVTISSSDTNWTKPTTPPSLTATSTLGGTSTTAGASGLTEQSYVDPNNGQNSTPATYTTGLQSTYTSAGNVGSGGTTSFALATGTTPITTLGSGFSMTTVAAVTLTGSANVNWVSTLELAPVPEPSSMAIAGLGALGMIGYGLRRRKAGGA